jgi:hypothetical protein
MYKSATSVPVSKGKKEKKLNLYIQSNIYLVIFHMYGERHINSAQKECVMTRERERDSHVKTVAGREFWERLLLCSAR